MNPTSLLPSLKKGNNTFYLIKKGKKLHFIYLKYSSIQGSSFPRLHLLVEPHIYDRVNSGTRLLPSMLLFISSRPRAKGPYAAS